MITRLVRKPLTDMVRKMQEQQEITPTGVEELRFVIRTYNKLLEENKASQEKLSHEASHDALTGLFNRGAYDLLMESTDREHMALILIDVDYFKGINDTYGHAVGDKVLKRVAELMKHSFRSVDILCRIGGDEFVVVMTRVNSSMSKLVQSKIERINDLLQHPKDGLPPVSLSVGVAFSDRENPKGDIFRDADTALYQVKEAGRNGCKIFDGNE
jgi:diguanylate cyclase (GGDEF)-like protein